MPIPSKVNDQRAGGNFSFTASGTFDVGPDPATILAFAAAIGGGSAVRINSIVIGGQSMTMLEDRSMQAEYGTAGRCRGAELIGSTLTGPQSWTASCTLLDGTPDNNARPVVFLESFKDVVSATTANRTAVAVSAGATFSSTIASSINARAAFLGLRTTAAVTATAPTVKDGDGTFPDGTSFQALGLSEPGAASSTLEAVSSVTDVYIGQLWSLEGAVGGDTTGPTLSAPTKQDTDTTATGGFTTNEANGTARMVWTRSATAPTAAQVKAGQNELGTTAGVAAPAALTITSVGAKTFAAATVATGLTWWGYVVHTDGAGNDSAVLELGPVYPGTARPVTDISVSGWSVTGAATHAAALNEDVANDSSFVTSPTLTTTPAAEVHALQKPLPAGSYTINVRADVSSGGGFIRVALLDDSNNVLGTSADQVLTASLATFALPVVTTGPATRIRTEVWN